jgi:hypothetical protein
MVPERISKDTQVMRTGDAPKESRRVQHRPSVVNRERNELPQVRK